jgi:hypothetical protein
MTPPPPPPPPPDGGGCIAEIANVINPVPLPAAFAALTVTLEVPAANGVPEITPFVPERLRPVGRMPDTTAKDVGALVARIGYGLSGSNDTRLTLSARATGTANAMTITQSGGDGGLAALVFPPSGVGLNELQEPLNAQVLIDGIAAGGSTAARVASGEAARGGRIAYDVPFDAEALAALNLEHGIVMIEPAELPHLRSIAAEAGVTLNPVGGTRAVRGSVATYRESVRRAIEEQDLDAQLSLLDPLFEQYSAAEVAAALSAMLRRHPSEIESTNADAGAPPPPAFVRLFVSLGQRDNIRPGDLVGAIAGEASIAGDQVGRIDIRDTFSVVEVSAADADRVIRALNGTTLRGRSLRVDYDRRGGATARERPARTRRPPNRS